MSFKQLIKCGNSNNYNRRTNNIRIAFPNFISIPFYQKVITSSKEVINSVHVLDNEEGEELFLVIKTNLNKIYYCESSTEDINDAKFESQEMKEVILTFINENEFLIDMQCYGSTILYLTNTGNVYKQFNMSNTFEQIPVTNIKQISLGNSHFLFLNNNNEVFACGNNSYQQIGLIGELNDNYFIGDPIKLDFTKFFDNNNEEYILKIKADFHKTYFITNKGRVLSCGENPACVLARQEPEGYDEWEYTSKEIDWSELIANEFIIDVQPGSLFTCFLTKDYRVLFFGVLRSKTEDDSYIVKGCGVELSFTKLLMAGDFIKNVYCGYNHMFFLSNDNRILSLGCNDHGECGIPGLSDVKEITEVFPWKSAVGIPKDLKKYKVDIYLDMLYKSDHSFIHIKLEEVFEKALHYFHNNLFKSTKTQRFSDITFH
ncbi:hypothetical protein ABK040_005385 [Willaertia magna]